MKKTLSAVLGGALGAIGIAACDETTTPDATTAIRAEAPSEPAAPPKVVVPEPVEPEVPDVGIADMIREADAYARVEKLAALLPTLGPSRRRATATER